MVRPVVSHFKSDSMTISLCVCSLRVHVFFWQPPYRRATPQRACYESALKRKCAKRCHVRFAVNNNDCQHQLHSCNLHNNIYLPASPSFRVETPKKGRNILKSWFQSCHCVIFAFFAAVDFIQKQTARRTIFLMKFSHWMLGARTQVVKIYGSSVFYHCGISIRVHRKQSSMVYLMEMWIVHYLFECAR